MTEGGASFPLPLLKTSFAEELRPSAFLYSAGRPGIPSEQRPLSNYT